MYASRTPSAATRISKAAAYQRFTPVLVPASSANRVRGHVRDAVDDILEQWRAARPDLDPSPIGIVGRISRLARELEDRLEPVYRDHGLEPGWHDVLATL